jgi:hypothetical protein
MTTAKSDLTTSASMGNASFMGNAPMTSVKLTGKNYVYWARSVEVFLRGKGLYTHLQSGKPSDSTSSSLWDQEDNQIISLMLNSVEPHIRSSCIYLPTAKDIWDHLSHIYSGSGNITRIYEVCKQYFGLEQGAQTVDEYYNQVVAICKEWDMYQPLSTDLKKMDKQRQDVDVVRFLLGLKPEYESVRAQILGGSNLPSLPEVFSRIQRATLSDHGLALNSDRNGDRAAFIVARGGSGSSRGGRVSRGGRGFRGGRDSRGGGVVVGLANALIVAEAIILWSIVGIYMAHHLGSPIRLLLKKILQPPLDHLLNQASIWSVIRSPFRKMSMLSS